MADVVVGLVGLNVEREGGRGTRARLKIRGASQTRHVFVTLDGQPLNPNFDGSVDLTQIPINTVERIVINRGGGSLTQGSESTGGSIDIITSRPEKNGLKVRLGTGVGRDGTKTHHGRFFGRSNVGDLTYLTSQEVSNGYSINEDYTSNNHFGNMSRPFWGDKGLLGISYFFQEAEEGVSNGTRIPFDQWNGKLERLAADEASQRTQESQLLKFEMATPDVFGGQMLADVIESRREEEDRASRGGIALQEEDFKTRTLNTRFRRKGFETGYERRDQIYELFGAPRVKTHQSGFYAQQKWETNRWTFLPGVRYERPSNHPDQWNPRVVMIFEPSETFLISGTATRSLQSTRSTFEKAWTYDMGFKWRSLAVTGFYTRLTNTGVEENMGLETDLRKQFKRTVFIGQWTFQRSRRTTPTSLGFAQTQLTPRHLLFFKIEHHLPLDMVLTNEVRYQSEQYELDNRGGVRLPSFYVWNVRFRIKILEADLYASVENLTRRRFAETLGVFNGSTVLWPQPERTFWTGVSIKFTN